MYANNPGLMIRSLLVAILGEKELSSMTAKGTKNTKGVPPKIYSVVESKCRQSILVVQLEKLNPTIDKTKSK